MAIKTGDNFSYKGRKPLDSRDSFDTILEMTSFATSSLDDGHISYCKETEKHYEFKSTNTFDTQLGYWKEYNGGTGSSTDEKVKLNNTSESKYLEELIDNSTIEVDVENGVIKAVSLDGLETTVATLNYVKNLDKDIMSYLSSIGNPMAFKGVVADDEALAAITDVVSGDTYIVQSSASNGNKTMTFIYNGVEFVPMAETSIEVRDFTAEPIDLATETTGILHKSKIDSAIARLADVCTLTKYKGTADGVVKQADKITGLTSTISALNEAVTNSHKHTNKAVLDKILSNGIGESFLADNGMYISFLHIGTTSPNYDSQLWVDNTDNTSPILKIFDGTDWITVSAPSTGTGSGGIVDIDTEMSDTSENAVQNKVIKKYVDGKSVNISADDNNAIKSNEDGIYVKDLSEEVNNISYAQKTVNKKLDYCYLQAEQTYISFKAGMVVPFNILSDSNNVETNSTNNSVKLKANKTYKISCDMFVDQMGYCYIELYDLTNDIVLAGFSKAPSSYNTTSSDSSLQYIYTPKENCEIQIKVKTVNGTIRMYNTLNTAYFIVEEIGKAVTIDPLEYVNESQGIEDTPVGHIIAHMGTTAPKHYLACDGSAVAVADYPYLAQHFKDSFGSEYYFGGSDGTMNLPDLRGEFLRGTGTNSHAEQGNGGEVGEHQDATQVPRTPSFYDSKTEKYVYSRELNTEGKNDLVNVDTRKYIPSGGRRYMSHGNGWQQDYHDTEAHEPYAGTVRPTNTSVLYCIKYEPTYFMQNTYNGNVYSTDEQIVGRWIDGKPIYQKTLVYDSLPTATNWTKLEDFPGVDTVVDIKHMFVLKSGYAQSTDGLLSDENTRFQITYLNDTISYCAGTSLSGTDAITNVHITIQYTKTTD